MPRVTRCPIIVSLEGSGDISCWQLTPPLKKVIPFFFPQKSFHPNDCCYDRS